MRRLQIVVVREDITRMKVDGIVNAANVRLLGGGGVDGSIHRAAGVELRDYCKDLPLVSPPGEDEVRCETGSVVVTPGFGLKAKWILHTVGPVWNPDSDPEEQDLKDMQLHECYNTCMDLSRVLGLRSIAIPAISTGVYGFPADRAAKIAVGVIKSWGQEEDGKLLWDGGDLIVYLVAFKEEDYQILLQAL